MSNEKTTYAELNLTKKSKKQQIKPRGAKGFTSGTEQEIYYAELNLQNATQSPQANDKNYHCKAENNSLVPHCAHCPPEGFTYFNNCYYTNHEKMSWKESVMACASRRSSLLYIESEEEMKFLVSILPPSWVGIFRNTTHHPWMSINGSISKLKIKEKSAGESNCVIVSPSLNADICTYPHSYYCKHKLQN
nr:unnamed protein product [Sorex araneus]